MHLKILTSYLKCIDYFLAPRGLSKKLDTYAG
jgi:hypothetical protein